MTYPRSHLIDSQDQGVYHVHSRCVRRAWLCGVEKETGRNFSHRREWIEQRILQLGNIFAIDVFSYAVMSNHYHVVLRIDPQQIHAWTDVEIAERWLSLCPGRLSGKVGDDQHLIRKAALLENSTRLEELRSRLGSLSWFMRFINEPLARLANKEDACTGRFWEGRFKSQRLLDETAILACMVYVDLNPVRAGTSSDVAASEFTSIKYRAREHRIKETMYALNTSSSSLPIEPISLENYIRLVRWTAATQSNASQGVTDTTQAWFRTIQSDSEQWFHHYLPKPGSWQRAIGSIEALKSYARDIGQSWIKTYSPQHSR
jgi:hypothetical protein